MTSHKEAAQAYLASELPCYSVVNDARTGSHTRATGSLLIEETRQRSCGSGSAGRVHEANYHLKTVI